MTGRVIESARINYLTGTSDGGDNENVKADLNHLNELYGF
jgi:hypothetical protein